MSDHKTQTFNTDLGQKASVERHEVRGKEIEMANHRVMEIGRSLNPMPDHLKYLGSMAVHIYQSEMLGQLFFMSQCQTLGDTPELLASTALTDLKGTAQQFYGRTRQTKRSGF